MDAKLIARQAIRRMSSPLSDTGRQARNLAVYLLIFFAVWTVRSTVLYPIDENIQSVSAAWRQIYADTVRLLIWVVPVLVYVGIVDRVDPFQFLYLNTPLNQRGLLSGSMVVVTCFALGLVLDYGLAGDARQLSIAMQPWPWYAVFLGLPIAPIAEEILFRGFVLRKAQGFMGFWPANVATSLSFVAIHWPYWIYSQGWQMGLIVLSVRIFIIGMLLGYLVRKTNSLWPSIAAHILNNLISVTVHIG
jgi:membrane protease YdiL (CAAX protease family)